MESPPFWKALDIHLIWIFFLIFANISKVTFDTNPPVLIRPIMKYKIQVQVPYSGGYHGNQRA